jgi:hypothetical protein
MKTQQEKAVASSGETETSSRWAHMNGLHMSSVCWPHDRKPEDIE